jgi:hypothetical protein
MELAQNELEIIAASVKKYLDGMQSLVIAKSTFDSVSDGDISYSFYRAENRFHGSLKEAGTFRDKGHFIGNVKNGVIIVSDQSTTNSFKLNF